jgi:hypothetical protein
MAFSDDRKNTELASQKENTSRYGKQSYHFASYKAPET